MKSQFSLILAVLFQISVFGQNLQVEWQQCFGGSESDQARDIIAFDNNYYIVGGSVSDDGDISFNHGEGDGWLIKTDSEGSFLWEKTYGGSNGEYWMRIIPTSNNNFYLLGSSYSSDGDITNDPYPESTDYWIVKIDSSGNIIWDRILGGNMLDQMWTGTPTTDGGVVAMGWSASSDGDVTEHFGAYDMWMVKLDTNGVKEWDFTVGTEDFDYGQAIIQTSDGSFLIGGSSTPDGDGNLTCEPFNYNAEAIIVKIDADRNIEWQQCYGGSSHDGILALLELEDGYLFSAYGGSADGDLTGSGWHGENDVWVVKIDFLGNILWQKCFGGSSYDHAKNIFKTEDGGYILVGRTKSHDGDVSGNHTLSEYDNDIWVIKLSSEGELLSQQCIGGLGNEMVDFGVVKKSDNNYVIAGQTDYGPSYDVACAPHGGNGDVDFWVFEIKDTTTNVTNQYDDNSGIKVYPNPARDYVVFELPATAQLKSTAVPKSTVIQNNTVISTSAWRRNPPTVWETAYKNEPANGSPDSKGVSHSTTQSQPKGFDMTGGDDGAVVVVFDVFGQTVEVLK